MATRKVISKAGPKKEPKKVEEIDTDSKKTGARLKKTCFFCQSKTQPLFTDTNTIRRFTTDRAKIVPHAKSGICARHQRALTRHIKYARHLALLPFTPGV